MSMMPLPKWLAFGTGIGLEVGKDDLRVSVARLRPSGPQPAGAAAIARYKERHAAEWGAEYGEFLRRHSAGHLAAVVLLPRRDVVVRLLSLPGVSKRDLPAAIALQVDTLHPFPEGEAVWDWSRLDSTGAVLVGITRRSTIERYAALFAEAGVKISGFTFSGAAFYSALRLPGSANRAAYRATVEWRVMPTSTASLESRRDQSHTASPSGKGWRVSAWSAMAAGKSRLGTPGRLSSRTTTSRRGNSTTAAR